MKFVIALCAQPHTPGARRALRFAQAALAQGHEISRLFFYQDGVWVADNHLVTPQDETDLVKQWRAFIQDNQLDAVVCIAAALRRGVLNETEAKRYQREGFSLVEGYDLSGLGQWHDALQQADRSLCFGAH